MSAASCCVHRGGVESNRSSVPSSVHKILRSDRGSVLTESETDADYFTKVYAGMFGSEKIPYPNAQSTEQRISNIEAIERDIEERFDVTLSHIPPDHIINRVSTAVGDLNEILEAIDVAKRTNKDIFEELSAGDSQIVYSPEMPRKALNFNFSDFSRQSVGDRVLCRHLMGESFALVSPPTTPHQKTVVEIVRNHSPKSATDSGVTAVVTRSAVSKSDGLGQSVGTISFLSEKIHEARAQAALLCGLCMNGSHRRRAPDLYELRNCLIKLGGDIEATVAAIDSLSPNPLSLLDPDETTATSIPMDSDEVAELYRLNTGCEQVLEEKRKLMLDSVTHCVRQLKGAINPIRNNAQNVTT